ncbi:hypothetical protein A4A49_40914 [Nicotiana attenuata]|uniref:Uncharacterized protein n=1 Tax=Nicotiana attenuata TaxID=49451 RepID=A0A1J6KC45_NICAT|nr:hypothetical protein A4A49_40914 [Nicotiana attenuata]
MAASKMTAGMCTILLNPKFSIIEHTYWRARTCFTLCFPFLRVIYHFPFLILLSIASLGNKETYWGKKRNRDDHFEAYEDHRNSYAFGGKIALLKKIVADKQ